MFNSISLLNSVEQNCIEKLYSLSNSSGIIGLDIS